MKPPLAGERSRLTLRSASCGACRWRRPMPVTFECPCGQTLGVRDEDLGKLVKCPRCKAVSTVPPPGAPPPPLPAVTTAAAAHVAPAPPPPPPPPIAEQ